MESSAVSAAKAHDKRAARLFQDPEVPGLAGAGTTSEKMAVVVQESKLVQQTLEKEDSRLQEVWERVDTDHSGTLDKQEVCLVLKEMGWEDITDQTGDEMMAVIDADGSGEVDFAEFSSWFLQQDKGLRADVAQRTQKLEEAMSDPMLKLPPGWLEKVLG